MVLGSNFYNFSQLIYHFLAGRFLGKASYGDLATIISIIGFIGIVQAAFNLTIIKYIASLKDERQVQGFIKWTYMKSLLIGLLIGVIVILSANFLASFLNISNIVYIVLLGPILFLSIVTTTGRSILQGLLRFDQFIYSLLAEAIGKIILTCAFIILGFTLFGALFAFLFGIVMALFITTYVLRKYLVSKVSEAPNTVPFLKYSVSVFLQGLALTSMYSTDLLIVKHFFSPEEAGLYAALAILGRVVFFGSSPITHVMFPIVAKKHLNGEKYKNILFLSIVLILAFSFIITAFYYYLPSLSLGFLYGSNFLDGGSLLWLFAVFMTLLSLAMLLTQFYLSIGKTKPIYLFIIAAILQAFLIWIIHPSILAVVQISIATAALLVISLFVYFFYIINQK